MTMNDSCKIALVNPKAHETPLVNEELPDKEDVNNCFVYDLSRSQGAVLRWQLHRVALLMKIVCFELRFSPLSI
jgi:hypothetical protein